MLRFISSLCLVLVVTSVASAQIPVPPLVPPGGVPAPAPLPPPAPLVVDGQVVFAFQAGGGSLEIGAKGEKGYFYEATRPVGFTVPIKANDLAFLDRALKAAEMQHYNQSAADVNKVAQAATQYYAANTNHYSRVHTTTDGTVNHNHVHSGTVTHRAEYDQPLCAQDRQCGSTRCSCGHERNVYWSYQHNRRYYRCYNTGLRRWYGSY